MNEIGPHPRWADFVPVDEWNPGRMCGRCPEIARSVTLHMTRDLAGEVIRREIDRFGDLITEVSP